MLKLHFVKKKDTKETMKKKETRAQRTLFNVRFVETPPNVKKIVFVQDAITRITASMVTVALFSSLPPSPHPSLSRLCGCLNRYPFSSLPYSFLFAAV